MSAVDRRRGAGHVSGRGNDALVQVIGCFCSVGTGDLLVLVIRCFDWLVWFGFGFAVGASSVSAVDRCRGAGHFLGRGDDALLQVIDCSRPNLFWYDAVQDCIHGSIQYLLNPY